jgi:hypothetical protein
MSFSAKQQTRRNKEKQEPKKAPKSQRTRRRSAPLETKPGRTKLPWINQERTKNLHSQKG